MVARGKPAVSGTLWLVSLALTPHNSKTSVGKVNLIKSSHVEDKDFKEADVDIIGVSPDPVSKQKEFVEKHGLTVCTALFLT